MELIKKITVTALMGLTFLSGGSRALLGKVAQAEEKKKETKEVTTKTSKDKTPKEVAKEDSGASCIGGT